MRFPRILCWVWFIALACKPAAVVDSVSRLDQLASEKLGKDVTSEKNATGAYILYVQKNVPTAPAQALLFVVFEVASQKIVLEQRFIPGFVRWAGDYQLELLDQPGMIRQQEDLKDYVKLITIPTQKF